MSRRPADRRPPAGSDPAPSAWPCLAARADGVSLQVSVSPNAKRTEADGLHDGALRVRLAAPPIEGRANAALVAWLAEELGVPRRDVVVALGESSRRKRVDIDVPYARAADWLARRLGGDAG